VHDTVYHVVPTLLEMCPHHFTGSTSVSHMHPVTCANCIGKEFGPDFKLLWKYSTQIYLACSYVHCFP